jgi:hypothetical protein
MNPQVKSTRVQATRGFRAHVNGQLIEVNPDDVVDLSVADAQMVVAAQKAMHVAADVKPRIQKDYVPERKRSPKRSTESLLDALVKATEANTQAIQALVASQVSVPKK